MIDYKKRALRVMDGNEWFVDPLENRIAEALEEMYNKGRQKGQMELMEKYGFLIEPYERRQEVIEDFINNV